MDQVELRLTQLQQAVAAGGEFFTSGVRERAQSDLQLAHERMRAGDGFVVAALVGGTGSGKSTLFNRLTGFDFARVSEVRPTTEEIMACAWSAQADELLDVLGVPQRRRIKHESPLTAGREQHEALVLLDTPDYDSVQLANSGQVARLVPLVDVLLWVLDPQKYADAAAFKDFVTLGRKYRRVDGAGRNKHTMIVVVNRIDTVAQSERDALLADIRRTLDGLSFVDVRMVATSALYGEGIAELDSALEEMAQDRSVWLATAQAQLDSVAELLSGEVGECEAELEGPYVRELSEMAVQASGVSTVKVAIGARGDAGAAGGKGKLIPQAPAPTLSVALRDMWVTHAIAGLPLAWQAAVESSVPAADRIRKAIERALASVPVPRIVAVTAKWWYLAGVLVIAAGVAWAMLASSLATPALRAGGAVAGIVLGLGLIGAGVLAARKRRRALVAAAVACYEQSVRCAVAETLRNVLVPGPETILKRHRAARTLLAGSQRSIEASCRA